MCLENRTHKEVVVGVAVQYVPLLSLWSVLGYWMTGELGNGHVQYI